MPTTATIATPAAGQSRGLNIALWSVQALLFAAFGLSGFMKSTLPIEALAQQMAWAGTVPPALIRLAAASEIAGALGLMLPALTRIQPRLTPLAAVGLVVVMVLAAGLHLMQGDFGLIVPNVVLGGLAGFVAWGRARRVPITARS